MSADLNTTVNATKFGSGAVVRRIEDPALLTGRGVYTDDVNPAGQVFLRFVRSTTAHAKLLNIDTTAALAVNPDLY